jgi:hypothetical protein
MENQINANVYCNSVNYDKIYDGAHITPTEKKKMGQNRIMSYVFIFFNKNIKIYYCIS